MTTATAPAVTPDPETLTSWGFAVVNDGITAHEDVATVVAEAAQHRGIRPILVEVLADRSEPAAARTRAFGRLAFALAR